MSRPMHQKLLFWVDQRSKTRRLVVRSHSAQTQQTISQASNRCAAIALTEAPNPRGIEDPNSGF
ncbi:MAG TPA: hypothetical protein VEZ50_05810 [Nodosilinea sp.]|nr:hypothetical protein [Nodosilinea sp.]